jgi:putative SOS response-associated peptidase YedK
VQSIFAQQEAGHAGPFLPRFAQSQRSVRAGVGDLSGLRRARRAPERRWRARNRFDELGFVLLQNGRTPRRVTNVRDDKILENRFSRGSFEERRCLVPASSFCEPNGDVKPASWHWFGLRGNVERPLFAFPGVWRRYQGPVRKDGPKVELEVYAFLTTTPNELVATINHERMPVLLTARRNSRRGSAARQAKHWPWPVSIRPGGCA